VNSEGRRYKVKQSMRSGLERKHWGIAMSVESWRIPTGEHEYAKKRKRKAIV